MVECWNGINLFIQGCLKKKRACCLEHPASRTFFFSRYRSLIRYLLLRYEKRLGINSAFPDTFYLLLANIQGFWSSASFLSFTLGKLIVAISMPSVHVQKKIAILSCFENRPLIIKMQKSESRLYSINKRNKNYDYSESSIAANSIKLTIYLDIKLISFTKKRNELKPFLEYGGINQRNYQRKYPLLWLRKSFSKTPKIPSWNFLI